MNRIFAVVLVFGMLLAGCSGQSFLPAAVNGTQNVAEPEAQAGIAAAQPTGGAAEAAKEGAGEITAQPTEEEFLSPQATYEMIGAVQANILVVESWLAQGITDFQRQAMVGPVVELSMAPLAELFAGFEPQPGLARYWDAAEDIHARFYPQVVAWVDGELDGSDFGSALVTLKIESNEMISQADLVAFQDFGIDTEAYLPDYSLAMTIVFELADMQRAAQPPLDYLLEATENANLLVREVNPYTYQFAGSELFSVVGLVENTGSVPLERVEVELRFFDATGEYLGTTWGSATAILAEPGKVYPFSASMVTDGEEIVIRQQWASYAATALARPLSRELDTYYHDFDLALVNVSQGSGGSYTIEGSLTNLGIETVDSAEIVLSAAAFDAEGMLVGVGEGSMLTDEMLGTGSSLPFEVLLRAVSGEPVRYQFYAEVILSP